MNVLDKYRPCHRSWRRFLRHRLPALVSDAIDGHSGEELVAVNAIRVVFIEGSRVPE